MGGFNVYNDINARTNGEIYIGVVGPVRTGKSTFIKRFMEMMVIPNIKDENDREIALDEMPQCPADRLRWLCCRWSGRSDGGWKRTDGQDSMV